MEQEPQLNAHNKAEFPPMHKGEFDISQTNLKNNTYGKQ